MNDQHMNICTGHAEPAAGRHLHLHQHNHNHQASAAEFSSLLHHQQNNSAAAAAAPALLTIQDSNNFSSSLPLELQAHSAAAFDHHSQHLLCNANPNSASSANSTSPNNPSSNSAANILHLLSAALNIPGASAVSSHDHISILNNFLQQPSPSQSPAAAPHNFFNQLSPCNGAAATNFDHFSAEMNTSANFLDLFTSSNTNSLTVVPPHHHQNHHGFLQNLQPLEAFSAAAAATPSPTLFQKRRNNNNNSCGVNSPSSLSIQLPGIPTHNIKSVNSAASFVHGASASRTSSPVAMASPNSIINNSANSGGAAKNPPDLVRSVNQHHHLGSDQFNDSGAADVDDCDALFRMGDDEISTPGGGLHFNLDTSGDEAQGGGGASAPMSTGTAAAGENRGPRGKVKGPPAKNLMAERRRRKKLNDRLYTLRSVVPKISKMDRASILGDAIEYLKELLQRINDLHNELEATPPQPPATPSCTAAATNINPNQLAPFTVKLEDCASIISATNSYGCSSSSLGTISDPSQPPKIEILTREGALNIHMLCPRRPGLLLSTMRALDSLGLDVQQAVISCFNGFALDVFRAEKSQEHDVAADDIKRVLLITASSTHT